MKTVAGKSGKALRSAFRLSISGGIGNIASTASVSSGSTSSAMLFARARNAPAETMSARASPMSARPASVSRGVFPERSKSATPSVASSVWIDWLTADCTRPRLRAAAEKLPASATATRVRN